MTRLDSTQSRLVESTWGLGVASRGNITADHDISGTVREPLDTMREPLGAVSLHQYSLCAQFRVDLNRTPKRASQGTLRWTHTFYHSVRICGESDLATFCRRRSLLHGPPYRPQPTNPGLRCDLPKVTSVAISGDFGSVAENFKLGDVLNNMCLTIPGGDIDDGVQLQIQPCLNLAKNRQLFRMMNGPSSGTVQIVWDAQGKVTTVDCNGSSAQPYSKSTSDSRRGSMFRTRSIRSSSYACLSGHSREVVVSQMKCDCTELEFLCGEVKFMNDNGDEGVEIHCRHYHLRSIQPMQTDNELSAQTGRGWRRSRMFKIVLVAWAVYSSGVTPIRNARRPEGVSYNQRWEVVETGGEHGDDVTGLTDNEIVEVHGRERVPL
ncbi:hypothetical protein DFH08DRAFT_807305 [Mycena albidolilacea]|uniref:Ricin B lectin domain-containing protein n=1 Tax=Mycena albidolilacea TaxID=1033008 RepID=A0AAD7A5J0_9AGAR|nr:hypothetical protein DFH08DRAFT_807305 [Mycena albidolilacea]